MVESNWSWEKKSEEILSRSDIRRARKDLYWITKHFLCLICSTYILVLVLFVAAVSAGEAMQEVNLSRYRHAGAKR
jgi:hypothetical protein